MECLCASEILCIGNETMVDFG